MKSKYLYGKGDSIYFDNRVIEYLVAKEIMSLDKYNEIGEEVYKNVNTYLEKRNIKVKRSILINYINKILRVYRKNIGCPLFQTFESIFKSTNIVYLNAFRLKDRVTLTIDLSRIFLQADIYIEDYLPYVVAALNNYKEYNETYIKAYIFNFLYNYDSIKEKVKKAIKEVDESYFTTDISLLFKNNKLIKILYRNAVNTFKDITLLDFDLTTLLVFFDYKDFINKLKSLRNKLTIDVIKELIENSLNKLTNIEKETLSLKEGFNSEVKLINEDIANKISRTKDRVRIILNNVNKKIKLKELDLINIPLFNLFKIIKNDKKYLSFEEFYNYINDNLLANKLLYLYSLFENNLVLSKEYNIIYIPYEFSIISYIDEFLLHHNLYILENEFDSFIKFNKVITLLNYRYISNRHYYLRKGKNESEIIANFINEKFIDGFKFSDPTNIYYLNHKCEEIFNYSFNITRRSLEGIMNKYNYILIDKGTYKASNNIIKLGDDLIDKILDFIMENKSIIKYEDLFNKFKDELKEYKVNNRYYLKGLIDSYLKDNFIHTREYIKPISLKESFKEVAINYLKSNNEEISFSNFNSLYKDINEYIFLNAINSLNTYVQFESEKFIPLTKLDLSSEDISKLKEILNTYILDSKLDFITSRGLFDYLKEEDNDLFSLLITKDINNHFRLFSLLKTLFNDLYYFKRPLISLKKTSNVNQFEIIAKYLSTLDEFSTKDVLNYIKGNGLRPIQNYLEFYLDYLNEFILVDKNKFIKIDKLNLSNEIILEIKNTLSELIKVNNELHIDEFNSYLALPLISYSWNKYLLFGLLNYFLSSDFNVKIINSDLKSLDYIINLK